MAFTKEGIATMPEVIGRIPEGLKKIYRAVHDSPPLEPNIDRFQPQWKQYVERVQKKIPAARIESGGEILYLNDLSPGCRSCKEGSWDCIFITMRCNLDCRFCLSPKSLPDDFCGSIFGTHPEEIAANQARSRITGISFSGGEPFLEMPRLLEWLTWFKTHRPDKYYWVYTNGLLAKAENLERLGDMGIDEIRFNLAATDYDHPLVMDNLGAAVRYIPNVNVEIPAVPEHTPKLLACLEKWCDRGVGFLNMHELMYEKGTNSESMTGCRQKVVTWDGHFCEIDPDSRNVTLAVMEKVNEQNLPLAVNDCSFQSKIRQLRGRRQSMAQLVRLAHEKLIDNEFLESYCAYRGDQVTFYHPDFGDVMRRQHPDCRYVRLVRTVPLGLQDPGRWITFTSL
jgi:pyruvate formate-lyase activating enzyme-like uncharacterized protein